MQFDGCLAMILFWRVWQTDLYFSYPMNLLHELACVNCGAVIRVMAMRGSVVSCDVCHASFRIPTSLTPEPELGDLLLGSDFREVDTPGWIPLNRNNLEFRPGTPAELWATFPPSDRI